MIHISVENIIKLRIRNTGIWWGSRGDRVHCLAKLCIICFSIINLTQIIELIISAKDLRKIFSCFSILSFCGMGFFKLCSLKLRKIQWIELINKTSSLEMDLLNNNDEFDTDSDGEETTLGKFNEYISEYTKKFEWTSTLLYKVYSFTAVVFILAPFIERGVYILQGNNVGGLPHILPGWSPLDFSYVGYGVMIIIEIIAASYCVAVHVAFDIAVVGLMIFVHGQYALLHSYSTGVGGKGQSFELSEVLDIRAHFRIAKCHRIHITLLRSVDALGKIIETILGIYFILATLTLCSVAMQFTWEELSITQLLRLLQYLCATLTQLYLYCHFGDAVFNESAVGLGEGPFCAAFWCLSPKIRKEIALLCVGMSQHRRLHAGFIYSLDLPSFINVVRTAYSYYAVLRGTSNKIICSRVDESALTI